MSGRTRIAVAVAAMALCVALGGQAVSAPPVEKVPKSLILIYSVDGRSMELARNGVVSAEAGRRSGRIRLSPERLERVRRLIRRARIGEGQEIARSRDGREYSLALRAREVRQLWVVPPGRARDANPRRVGRAKQRLLRHLAGLVREGLAHG